MYIRVVPCCDAPHYVRAAVHRTELTRVVMLPTIQPWFIFESYPENYLQLGKIGLIWDSEKYFG